ncbi:10259_t:CDS:2 [Entrophospora sp. SA101]|nr:10251_t:CDS:2 [Entrophospora sp. SA101]CAJ0875226.1 10259_t:CDS:2 [Entrophospora sp. SA101]
MNNVVYVFNDDLFGVYLGKEEALLNKPIYVGSAGLDLILDSADVEKKLAHDVILVSITNRHCSGSLNIEQIPQLLLIYPENINVFSSCGLMDGPNENDG